MPAFFDPLPLRSLVLRNRVGMSPLYMYSCEARDGAPTAWHMTHLGARAAGGCSLVLCGASASSRVGGSAARTRAVEQRAGHAWRPFTGAVAGMQLAHTGRKAGTQRPADGRGPYADEELFDGVHRFEDLWPAASWPVQYGRAVG